jgi:hypothetical protein
MTTNDALGSVLFWLMWRRPELKVFETVRYGTREMPIPAMTLVCRET